MSEDQAERWVIVSALVVFLIYGARRIKSTAEPGVTLPRVVGLGDPVPLASFVMAWGVTFFGVSLLATAAPAVGGAFAILLMTTDFLSNAPALWPGAQAGSGKVSTTPEKLDPLQPLQGPGS